MAKKRYKRLIQIKTNKRGWKTVEFLKYLGNNKILIQLPSGDVIARKRKNVRMFVARKIRME